MAGTVCGGHQARDVAVRRLPLSAGPGGAAKGNGAHPPLACE
jgi:hypothetical protein